MDVGRVEFERLDLEKKAGGDEKSTMSVLTIQSFLFDNCFS